MSTPSYEERYPVLPEISMSRTYQEFPSNTVPVKQYHHIPRISGYLKIYLGPMFSGKTQRLLADLTTMADTGASVLYINHVDDTRGEIFSTHHSGIRGIPDNIIGVKCSSLASVDVENYTVIGVDEAQFFGDLKPVVEDWVNNRQKYVICSSLDGDYKMEPFGSILKLIPICNSVKKLNACCVPCLAELNSMGFKGDTSKFSAPFTTRRSSDSGHQVKDIGGAEKYIPVCRHHHLTLQKTEV